MSEKAEDSSIINAKDTTAALTGTVGAVGAALGTNPTMAPWQVALIAGFVALMPGVLAASSEAFVTRKRRSAQKFWDTITKKWAESEDKTPEEIAGLLEARKDEPHINETIWRSIRSLMEAADEAATMPLAVLAQDYLRQEKRPDAFFRGTVRLLQELDRLEMEELATMLNCALETSQRPQIIIRANLPDLAGSGDRYMLSVNGDGGGTRLFHNILSDPLRLFGLLEREQLTNPSGTTVWPRAGLDTIVVRTVAERLCKLLVLR
ncbi:hypothetical protein [Polyangium sp. 6x1]|uniref:hypothetical protein n=1 Tax=Polyangium sp. 6x1 TaxID=3042689 RepID=UPI002482E3BD|nr:hypothetical protein [Polyangium sp. 6x1]MDI1449337.1 hypothetical protein [Polyangium sp. 6x1]